MARRMRKVRRAPQPRHIIVLGPRDHRAFMAALDADMEPNAALKRAVRRYNQRHAKG